MDQEQIDKAPSGGTEFHRLQLIDRIVRDRIFSNRYWKEECFGLNAETLVDKAIELSHIGGTCSSTGKPTPYLCLIAKLLQISPDMDVIHEFINNRDYKYVNALALFYIRLVAKPKDVYTILEMFYSDFRKLRIRNQDGTYTIIYMDEFVDQLLIQEYYFSTQLPRLPKRVVLEENGQIQPRKSELEKELEQEIEQEVKETQNQVTNNEQQDEQTKNEFNGKNKSQEVKEKNEKERSRSKEHKKKHKKHKKHKNKNTE